MCKRALVDLFIGWDFFFFLPTSVSLAAFWHFCWFIYAVSHHLLKTQSVGQAGGAFGEQSRQAARESSSPSCQLGLLLAEPLGARTARRKRRRDKERPGLSNEKKYTPFFSYLFIFFLNLHVLNGRTKVFFLMVFAVRFQKSGSLHKHRLRMSWWKQKLSEENCERVDVTCPNPEDS